MQGGNERTGGWKAGTVVFLVLALALAVFSGDILLVLAVATAVAGLALLVGRRREAPVRRPAAAPQHASATVSATEVRPNPRGGSRRMAQRRYRSAASLTRRARQAAGSAHSSVADAPGQAQVIQVLQ